MRNVNSYIHLTFRTLDECVLRNLSACPRIFLRAHEAHTVYLQVSTTRTTQKPESDTTLKTNLKLASTSTFDDLLNSFQALPTTTRRPQLTTFSDVDDIAFLKGLVSCEAIVFCTERARTELIGITLFFFSGKSPSATVPTKPQQRKILTSRIKSSN